MFLLRTKHLDPDFDVQLKHSASILDFGNEPEDEMNVQPEANEFERFEKWNRKLVSSWSSADYSRIGITLQVVGETLAEAASFAPGSSVLDVAAGNGNASLAMARRFCNVTSTDLVPEMLVMGRRRARAEGLSMDFEIADAQNLHYADASFDGVVSTFGVMFAPNQAVAAAELVRVCKPGGRIALACWAPDGFVGRVCAAIGRHMSASPGFKSPQNWGRAGWLREHFDPACASVRIERKAFNFRYRSPEHYLEYTRTHYGLLRKAFEVVGPEGEAALENEILAIAREFNVADDGTMCAPSAYAQAIMIKA